MCVLRINSSTPIFYFAVLLKSFWRLIYYQFIKRIKYIFSAADYFHDCCLSIYRLFVARIMYCSLGLYSRAL